MNLPRIIAITGPSTSGKSTLITRLLEVHPAIFHRMVSTTTRRQRSTEVNGVDYTYVTEETFTRLEQEGAFFDTITTPGGTFGSPRPYTSAGTNNKILVYNISLPGALRLRELYPNTRIFYLSISKQVQEQRLIERGTTLAEIAARTQPFETENTLAETHAATITILNANHLTDTEENVTKVCQILGL